MKLKYISAILIIFFSISASAVYAVDMTSTNYNIIFGSINSGGNSTTSTNYNLDVSLGQTAAKKFNSSGYVVKAGFQYVRTLYPFSFSLSDTSINLGTLIPDTASTQPFNISINNRGQGYDVSVIADTRLKRIFQSDEISDTSCNGGAQTCTETTAALWTSTTAYGFGYNMSGNDIPSDFASSQYFRRFPTQTDAEQPSVIMTSNTTAKNRTSTITLKAVISGAQPAGTYQTVLRFIAVPKY